MTATDTTAYDIAREYITLSDTVRLMGQVGMVVPETMGNYVGQLRTRLDTVMPSARRWTQWDARRTAHRLAIIPAYKMDTPEGLFRPVCSCGYRGGVDTHTEAHNAGRQHVKAKVTAR